MVQEPADNREDRMDFKAFTTTTKLSLSSGENIWREEGGLCRVFISLMGQVGVETGESWTRSRLFSGGNLG